jgi:hypothetical protein
MVSGIADANDIQGLFVVVKTISISRFNTFAPRPFMADVGFFLSF